MATVTLNNLWAFIESLSLSQKDRNWLANKLVTPYQVDPFLISPSGDAFFSDSRNVRAVEKDIADAHKSNGQFVRLETKEDVMELINSL